MGDNDLEAQETVLHGLSQDLASVGYLPHLLEHCLVHSRHSTCWMNKLALA